MHTPESLAEIFRKIEDFAPVPEADLLWMASKGSVIHIPKGDLLFEKGLSADYLLILLTGKFTMYAIVNGLKKEMAILNGLEITGVLPYSRMKEASGFAIAEEDASVFQLHRDHFPEMIRERFDLTAAFVHRMTNRVRNFTAFQQQNEKLIALGKLSAGLTHELNNPASAIVRSASELKKHLQAQPDAFKKIINIQIEEKAVDGINAILFRRLKSGLVTGISLIERSSCEDEIAEWLEDNGMDDGYEVAENFVDFGFEPEDFEELKSLIPKTHFVPIVRWLDNNLNTEKMVQEISEAAGRIAELIGSVKSYSYMDQSLDKQVVDVHKGLRSTARMLQHKMKKHNVTLQEDFKANPGEVKAFPGELNQVWTNLMDNALDAMAESDTKILTLKTWRDNHGNFRVLIGDTGTGIPEEIRSKIFDPFFTTKDVGQGTGLGLDVVNKIITEQHRGAISVHSEPGKTEFEVCLPAD